MHKKQILLFLYAQQYSYKDTREDNNNKAFDMWISYIYASQWFRQTGLNAFYQFVLTEIQSVQVHFV